MREQVRDLESLSGRIVALRRMMGWTPRQAYEACGINKTTWNNYETGSSRPTIDHAAAICDVFGVTLDFVYVGDTSGLSPTKLRALYGDQA